MRAKNESHKLGHDDRAVALAFQIAQLSCSVLNKSINQGPLGAGYWMGMLNLLVPRVFGKTLSVFLSSSVRSKLRLSRFDWRR